MAILESLYNIFSHYNAINHKICRFFSERRVRKKFNYQIQTSKNTIYTSGLGKNRNKIWKWSTHLKHTSICTNEYFAVGQKAMIRYLYYSVMPSSLVQKLKPPAVSP